MKLVRKYNIHILVAVVLLMIFGGGCKSKKAIVDTGGVVENKAQNELLDDILRTELNYKTLDIKGDIRIIKGESEMKSSMVLKMVKDSIIQISIRPILGREFFRLEVTPKGFIVLDRLEKRYISETFETMGISGKMDFDFYNLQALLTNKIFVPGKQDVSAKDYQNFKAQPSTENLYMLQTKDKSNILYNFAIDASNHIASTLVLSPKNNLTIQWAYDDFVKDGTRVYPTLMKASMSMNKINLAFNLVYSKVDIDSNPKIDSTIPNSYKQVELMELVDKYMKKK